MLVGEYKDLTAGAPFQNNDAVSTADVVCDLRSVAFVVHEKQLKFSHVIHQELLQTIRK